MAQNQPRPRVVATVCEHYAAASLRMLSNTVRQPLVVGLGGTPRTRSSTELALRCALAAAERAGARTQLITGAELLLPLFDPNSTERSPVAQHLLTSLRESNGVIVASPGYHGGVSGLVKNALDYVEDLRPEASPYLDGRAAGCIVCAGGWQAANSALAALRSIMHALRAWPTPLGVAVNSLTTTFASDGTCVDDIIGEQLALVGRQVAEFALMRQHFVGMSKGSTPSAGMSPT